MFALRRTATVLIAAATMTAGLSVAAVQTAEGAAPAPLSVGEYWQHQTALDCAEMSAAAIIGSLTGSAPSEADVTAIGALVAGYTPKGGTPSMQIPDIFRAYGLTAYPLTGLNITDLQAHLSAGERIQVLVNGQTLWKAHGLDWVTPGTDANHAVAVDSIDDLNGVVHVVDSAIGDRDEAVSVAVFEKAWRTSGHWTILVSR